MQILASGKTGAQRYDDNNVSKPVPDLDLISIGQTNQRAFEETQGWSYSNNKGSTDSQATNLSVIEEGDVNDYNPSLAQLIQTYVANNSFLDVNGSSTANNIILEPRKIADVNSPNGVNYSKTTSLPFAFRDNLRFCFRATATNTGAVQFSITGLSGLSGAIDSVDENGNSLTGGEIVSGKFYEIVLTGTATTKKVILLNSDSFDNLTINNKLNLNPNAETISSGVIPYSGAYIVADTEGGASSDDLDTISGGSIGDVVKIRSTVNGRDITIKSSTGNILLPNDKDVTLSRSENFIELIFIGSFWAQTSRSVTNDPLFLLPPKAIELSNGTDADHDIDFTAGNFYFDDGSGQAVASALTKQIDAAWAEGDAAGGLDTGSVAADTTYHMFAIWNPATETADFLFSLSETSPTLPSGYTKKRKIAALRTEGSANIRLGTYVFGQGFYEFFYRARVVEFNSTSLTTSGSTFPLETPPNAIAQILMSTTDTNTDDYQIGVVATYESFTLNESSADLFNVSSGSVSDVIVCSSKYVKTDSSRQIKVFCSAAKTSRGTYVTTLGWKEYLS